MLYRRKTIMKKLITVLLAAMTALTFAGCASEESQAKKTADAFWGAMTAGNEATARTYISGEAVSKIDTLLEDVKAFSEISVSTELSEETQAVVDEMSGKLLAGYVKNYEFVSIEKNDDGGYDASAIVEFMNKDDFKSMFESVDYEALVTENFDEYMSIYTSEGMGAATDFLYRVMFSSIIENLDSMLAGVSYEKKEVSMKIDKVNDKWKITDLNY